MSYDAALSLLPTVPADSTAVSDFKSSMKEKLEEILARAVDDVVVTFLSEMLVANRHTLGYVAEQLSAVLSEEQIDALCSWIADELFLLNGGSGSAKPAEAHDDAAAAETAAVAVPAPLKSLVVVKKASTEAKPASPAFSNFSARAFKLAVDPDLAKKRQDRFQSRNASAPLSTVPDVATGLDLTKKSVGSKPVRAVVTGGIDALDRPLGAAAPSRVDKRRQGDQSNTGGFTRKSLESVVVQISGDNRQAAARPPITIKKRRVAEHVQAALDEDPDNIEPAPEHETPQQAPPAQLAPYNAFPGPSAQFMDPSTLAAMAMAMASVQAQQQHAAHSPRGGFWSPPAEAAPTDPSRVRCKYFPSCTKPGCVFAHPTVPCRFGYACTKGSSCLFLHEAPKKRAYPQKAELLDESGQPIAKSTIPCRFGTRCTKIVCPFQHPDRFDPKAKPAVAVDPVAEAALSESLPATP